jgi:hypothetical protein
MVSIKKREREGNGIYKKEERKRGQLKKRGVKVSRREKERAMVSIKKRERENVGGSGGGSLCMFIILLGVFSNVLKCKDSVTGNEVAIKLLRYI